MRRALVAVVLLAAATARAGDRAAAQRYFRAGAEAYAAQSFAAAAMDFEEAYKALPLPEIAFSAAQAYRRQYRVEPKPAYVLRAIALYKVYLANVKTGGRVGDAADSLGEMERELDRLRDAGVVQGDADASSAPVDHAARIGVSVTIAGRDDAGVALREVGDATGELAPHLIASIDGTKVAPFTLVEVSPGPHVIAVRADGYKPVQARTVAMAGQASFVEAQLEPEPAHVRVRTAAGAHVVVDGRAAGDGPDVALELAAGKHLLAIDLRGHAGKTEELAVRRGQLLALDAPLQTTRQRRAVPWVAAGGGLVAAAAITTGVLAAVHDGRASRLLASIHTGNRPPGDADAYMREVSDRDHFVTATWLLGGTAVAAGLAAAALYWFDTPAAPSRAIVPTVGGSGLGVSVFATF